MTSLNILPINYQDKMLIRITIITSISKNKMTVSFTDYHHLGRWIMQACNNRFIGQITRIEEL